MELLYIVMLFAIIFLFLGILQTTLYSAYANMSAPDEIKLLFTGGSLLVIFAPVLKLLKR